MGGDRIWVIVGRGVPSEMFGAVVSFCVFLAANPGQRGRGTETIKGWTSPFCFGSPRLSPGFLAQGAVWKSKLLVQGSGA